MMRDITSREDIEVLVDSFYEQVLKDELIGAFFTEVIQLDWAVHIPIMYDFWETLLLDHMVYKGNPMAKHLQLNRRKQMLDVHFERWLSLWETTVRANFSGPNADEAINRAKQIGGLMKFKIETQG